MKQPDDFIVVAVKSKDQAKLNALINKYDEQGFRVVHKRSNLPHNGVLICTKVAS